MRSGVPGDDRAGTCAAHRTGAPAWLELAAVASVDESGDERHHRVALAPLVASWGGKLELFGWQWPRWMSAAVLGAFLTFFPIAVNTLRGLLSPNPAALELMDSFAAPWHRTLFKLRFPAAVPYIVPGMKLGAAGAVIGVVVSEISTGLRGGIGRLVIEFGRATTSDPAIVYTAIIGAAFVGLSMAALVAGADAVFMRNRPKETQQ